MNKLKLVPVGVSLSATVVVLYLLCALAAWVAPGSLAAVLNLTAHGINLSPLFQQATDLTLPMLLGGTLVLAVYFFVAGWLFAWIYNRFIRP